MKSFWCTVVWWTFGNNVISVTCSLKCVAHLLSCTDRTAHGVGARGVPQHTQEDGVMSTGTHRRRCRKETCKGKNMLIIAAVSQLSTVFRLCNPHKFRVMFQSVHTYSQWFFFFFSCPPPYLKHALQSVPRLYTGNGQVKKQNPRHSTSLVLGTACSISHSDICCLHSLCMTLLPLGFSLQKQDVQNFYKFSLTDVVKVDRCLSIVYCLKFHLMSVLSSFVQKALFPAQWKILDDFSFGINIK